MSTTSDKNPLLRFEKMSVWGLGVITILCTAALALLTLPFTDADETGLFNPVYMFVQTGNMTYPIYYHWDSMVVHPPLHYFELGMLMKLGMSFVHAEAVPAILFVGVAVAIVCPSRMSQLFKLALLFGLFAGITINVSHGHNQMHGIRPDLHVAVAWFAALVALEAGRRNHWDVRLLILGGFLLTYSSGVHYFGVAGALGIGAYLIAAALDLRRKAVRPATAMIAGCLLAGVPYLAFFVIPDWDGIRQMTSSVQGSGGVGSALARQFAQYAFTGSSLAGRAEHIPLTAGAMLPVLTRGLPPLLIAAVILLVRRETRWFTLAALPLPLFVMLYSQGKSAGYYVPEFILYLCAAAVAVGAVAEGVLRYAPRAAFFRPVFRITAAVILAVSAVKTTFAVDQVSFASLLRPHPMDVARAAAKEMLGPQATVAGRIGLWYVTGADAWFEVESALLWRALGDLDVRAYLERFDAVADQYHMSNASSNDRGETLSSWYADGTLGLRGFYFDSVARSDLSYLLLHPTPAPPLVGFARHLDTVVRFVEDGAGDSVYATLICSRTTSADMPSDGTSFTNFILLPDRPGPAPLMLLSVLSPNAEYAAQRQRKLADCDVRQEVRGRTTTVAANELVSKLAREDRPMTFLRSAAGAGLRSSLAYTPPNRAKVGQTVEVRVDAAAERNPPVRATLSINEATDGSARGEWVQVGQALLQSGTPASFVWHTATMKPGRHLVALNLDLADGTTVWWYEQEPRSYELE